MPLRGRVQPCVWPVDAAPIAAVMKFADRIPNHRNAHPGGLSGPPLDRFVITSRHPYIPPDQRNFASRGGFRLHGRSHVD